MSAHSYTAFPPKILLVPDADDRDLANAMAFLVPDGLSHAEAGAVLERTMDAVTQVEEWTWEDDAIPRLGAAGLVFLEPFSTRAF